MSQSTRQLAAIMFTDIAGYTSLMGSNEEKAFKLLRKNHEIHKGLIKHYDGRLIKEMGDGTMISFQLASDAVRCAIEIQKACKQQDVPLKIGIHQGEMVFAGADVFGDGVNIASRLQESTKKGCITVSSPVFSAIKNKTGIKTKYLEERTFKNVEEPIKVYHIDWGNSIHDITAPNKHEPSLSEETKISIAVLPFVNMSNEPEQEYFCDGMTEEIINALANVESLKVIARTSSFMFKNKLEDMRLVGKKLDVANLLEGSVRKFKDKIRVTAQLINVADGSHLWSERYDRNLDDIFAIQDDITLAIVDSLKVKLLGKEKEAIVKRYTSNIEANLLFFKGRQLRLRKNPEDFVSALKCLEESISLDPQFSMVYAEIALTYVLMGWFGSIMVNNKLRELIVSYTDKALDLDKYISEAYIALALTAELIDHDRVKAEKLASKAVRLNPGNYEAIQEHAFILGRMEQFEPAIEKMKYTISRDPLSIMANNGLGHIYFYQGNFKSAIKQMQYILQVDPTFLLARYIISLSLTEMKDYSNAINELAECPESNPSVIAQRGYLYAKLTKTEEAYKILDKIKRAFSKEVMFEFLIALIYSGMEDKDNAYKWLKKSQDKYGFVYRDRTIGSDFRIDSLKKDPRFSKLIYY